MNDNTTPALTLVSPARDSRKPAVKRQASTSKANARKRRARVSAKQRRTVGQVLAAAGACILPAVSWEMVHIEAATQPLAWGLVAAALMFSVPSVITWAKTWTGNVYKASGFAVLLEGAMVISHQPIVQLGCLGVLCLVNAYAAWRKAEGK